MTELPVSSQVDAATSPILPEATVSRRLPSPDIHAKAGFLPALQSLIYIIVVAIFIITFTAQPFRIPSGSMEPTLLIGDFLLVDKQGYSAGQGSPLLAPAEIRRGEIIVFHFPTDPSLHLVKRVIGLPGERVRLRDGHVFINGRQLTEPYAVYRAGPPDSFRDNFPRLQSADPDIDSRWWIRMHTLVDHGELLIPAGDYFVLGDNRNDSEDSRYWGFVPRAAIVGRPFLVYFSLQQSLSEEGSSMARAQTSGTHRPEAERSFDSLVDFARWDRTLHVVR